jgi:hypothetical protein
LNIASLNLFSKSSSNATKILPNCIHVKYKRDRYIDI